MPAPYTGRCNCGAVTGTVTGEPLVTRQCWCRQCQKAAAGGPPHNAIFLTKDVALSGKIGHWSYVAPSGNTLTQSHCPACGSCIHAQSSAWPERITIRMGFLNEGHGLRPQMAIWTEDAPEWAVIDPALERFEQQPPAPALAQD